MHLTYKHYCNIAYTGLIYYLININKLMCIVSTTKYFSTLCDVIKQIFITLNIKSNKLFNTIQFY